MTCKESSLLEIHTFMKTDDAIGSCGSKCMAHESCTHFRFGDVEWKLDDIITIPVVSCSLYDSCDPDEAEEAKNELDTRTDAKQIIVDPRVLRLNDFDFILMSQSRHFGIAWMRTFPGCFSEIGTREQYVYVLIAATKLLRLLGHLRIDLKRGDYLDGSG